MADSWPDDSIFQDFDIFEETYKTIDSHPISVSILTPPTLSPGLVPMILSLHGGFLMTGHALFAPFFTPSVLALALAHNAVIVSPNYRLLPSAKGVADILEDLEDFWAWMRQQLPGIFERHFPGHSLDFSKMVLQGGSAGGYAAIQLALSHPDDVAAMVLTYPFVDPKDHIFTTGPESHELTVFRFPLEEMPPKEDVISWIEESRGVLTTKAGMERTAHNVATTQYGLFYSHVFNNLCLADHDLLPFERIKHGAQLPKKMYVIPVPDALWCFTSELTKGRWIVHGDDDSVVYIRSTYKLVDLVQKTQPDVEIRLDVAQGQDHAFDHLNKEWQSLIKPGGYDFVRDAWLGKTGSV